MILLPAIIIDNDATSRAGRHRSRPTILIIKDEGLLMTSGRQRRGVPPPHQKGRRAIIHRSPAGDL